MLDSETKTLILGIGNFLMGDEGIGVHLIKALEKEALPENVTLLDGGTAGLRLLSQLDEFEQIIIVDAALNEKPPGTVQVVEPRYFSDYPPSMSVHDLGLKDLIEGSLLLGKPLHVKLILISIDQIQSMKIGLSTPIQKVIPEIIKRILRK